MTDHPYEGQGTNPVPVPVGVPSAVVAPSSGGVVVGNSNGAPNPGGADKPRRSFTKWIDDWLRFSDLSIRRTVGGWWDGKWGFRGHSLAAVLLPTILCGLLALGSPTPERGPLAIGVAAGLGCVFFSLLWGATRCGRSVTFDFFAQVGLIAILSGCFWRWGSSVYDSERPYVHLFVPLTFATALALLFGRGALYFLCKGLAKTNRYPGYLKKTELFASSEAIPPQSLGVLLSAVAMPLRAPLALLTIPALVTLLTTPASIPLVPGVAFGICLGVLLLSGANERLGFMWLLLQQNLFRGGALLISLVAIALAGARLAQITYVTTIFDSAAWRAITALFASAYVLAWWFDYWSYRLLTEQLLRLLAPKVRDRNATPYTIRKGVRCTNVPADGRVLQAHGSGRLIAIREFTDSENKKKEIFQAYDALALVDLVATRGAPGGKAVPSPVLVRSRAANYLALTMAAFVALVGVTLWELHKGEQAAELAFDKQSVSTTLQTLLTDKAGQTNSEPFIVVAASGGGTRAAVYTASVLEAITRAHKGERVVFGSGVSGGGAALAYFAGHRDELAKAWNEKAWNTYFEKMSEPFIQDVLDQSTEWYMVREGRLGMLLRDSFRKRWDLPERRNSMGKITDMGLMLNTSLAGEYASPLKEGCTDPLVKAEREHRKDASSSLAGGRLVLTNLWFPDDFRQDSLEPDVGDPKLPVLVQSPTVRLEDAAALNANFPPVFSNAAIDDGCETRYWVTDGGAVDNRGMEMMLLALKKTLEKMKATGSLPPLHIVIADASALDNSFSQNRGVASMTGAGTHFASHLNSELYSEIVTMYGNSATDKLRLSYVMMPDILRKSGSFGTHWMLQDTIKVHHQDAAASGLKDEDKPPEQAAKVPGVEMVRLMRALQSADVKNLSPDGCKILGWAWGDTKPTKGWKSFREAFAASAPTGGCQVE